MFKMSWSKDEWKQDLPPKAIQNITNLENELEKLQKHTQQQDIKIDGYMASLEKEKNNLQETKAMNAALQNEVQELIVKNSNLETKQEKLAVDVRNKEISLNHTEEILEKVRQKLKSETVKSAELQRSLDMKKTEAENYAEQNERLANEVTRLKQDKAMLVKEKQGLKEELIALQNNRSTTKNDNKQTTAEANALTSKSSSGDVIVEMLKKENSSLVKDLKDIKQQRDQLRHLVEEKEKEVERGRSKITNLSVDLQAAEISLKESEQKNHRLELIVETKQLDIMKLQRDLDKYKENEQGRMKKIAVQVQTLEEQYNEENNEEKNAKKEILSPEPRQPTEQHCCEKDLDEQEGKKDKKVLEEDGVTSEYKEGIELDREEIVTDKRLRNSCSDTGQATQPEMTERCLDLQEREVINDEESNSNMASDTEDFAVNLPDKKTDDVDKKIQKALDKTGDNEMDKNMEQRLQNTEVDEHCQSQSTDGVRDEKESTLEELMSLLIESLRKANEMRPMEPCVVQNLNQVIVVSKDSDLRHGRNVQSTQTMAITQFDEECQTITSTTPNEKKGEVKNSEDIGKDSAANGKTNSNSEDMLSRFCEILFKLQDLHDKIAKSTTECEDIIITVKAGIMKPELSISALISRLFSQIGFIGSAIERCSNYSESLAQEITQLIKMGDSLTTATSSRTEEDYCNYDDCQPHGSDAAPSKNEPPSVNVPSPEDSDDGSQDHSESQDSSEEKSSKKDLSWDNFESDQAFLQFKSSMDKVLKELGGIGNAALNKKKAQKRKPSNINGGQVQGDEIQGYHEGIENKCCETDRVIETLSQVVDESNARWLRKTQELFHHLKTRLLDSVDRQIKHAMIAQHTGNPTTPVQDAGNPTTPVQDEEAHDDDACRQLEVIKSKLSEVQNLVKLLSVKADVAENEKEKAFSRIDVLSNHMINLESNHELRCKELEEDLKTASDVEISLQRKCSSLQQEKDDIDKEMKANTRQLHQKELELLKLMKKIRKIQAEYEKTETSLRNDNEELRKKNCSIWRDYEKVSTDLEDKKRELKSLMDSMKTTEHSLLSLFNTIGNIDDFLQRAREMNLFHE